MIFTVKDIMIVFNCSRKTAYKRMDEIKTAYKIKYITGFHVARFLHISIDELHYYYLTKVTDKNSDIGRVVERMEKSGKKI